MAKNYEGWTLFPKVTIVSKEYSKWNHPELSTGEYRQGYVVDASNSSMLASARRWGTETHYGEYDHINHCYPNMKTIEPTEETFDNEGFTLQLLDSAEGSSQGGKLSFWNCLIKKDDKQWIIGIAANLLIDVLKNTTVVNGVVQEPLFFARCKSGVGMLSINVPSYQQAISDMAEKARVSKGKTSKHKLGHLYETINCKNVYIGDLWSHYEPVYENDNGWRYTRKLTGFKRRVKPLKLHFFPSFDEEKTKASQYLDASYYYLEKKLPARIDSGEKVEIDIDMSEFVAKSIQHDIEEKYKEEQEAKARGLYMANYVPEIVIGLSDSDDSSYQLPECVKEFLHFHSIVIID